MESLNLWDENKEQHTSVLIQVLWESQNVFILKDMAVSPLAKIFHQSINDALNIQRSA